MTRRWKHIKRGTVYIEIARGTMQSGNADLDNEPVVIYTGADGKFWVRPVTEFEDGRFEPVETSLQKPQTTEAADPWSPWFDWKGHGCPVPWAGAGDYELKTKREPNGDEMSSQAPAQIRIWDRRRGYDNFVTAFRYRLDRAPADFVYPPVEK